MEIYPLSTACCTARLYDVLLCPAPNRRGH